MNTEDMTLVVEMDGVKLVLQGDLPQGSGVHKSYDFGPKSRLHGHGKARSFTFPGPHGPSELREHFQRVLPGTAFEEFEGGRFRVPPELRERLREIIPHIPFEQFEGEGPQVFRFPPEVRELRDTLIQDL